MTRPSEYKLGIRLGASPHPIIMVGCGGLCLIRRAVIVDRHRRGNVLVMNASIYELLTQIGDENRSKVGNLTSDFTLQHGEGGCAIFRWSNHEHGYAQGFVKVKISTLPEWAKKVLAAGGVMYASEAHADAWVDYD